MYEFVLQTVQRATKNYNAEKRASDVKKKWRISINRISKVSHTTCNWIKILDEATWMANVFLISWFFYSFLSCSTSLLVKYDFILRYEAWVNVIRASSFIENVPQISAKTSEICSGSSHEIGHSLPIIFQRNWPRKFPRNRPFFPRICPWKSREIWLFFRDLPEALSRVEMKRRERTKVEGTKTIFFVWRKTKNKNKKNWTSSKYFVLVQKILYWFKNFVLVQKKLYQRQKLNYNKSTSCMRMFDQQFRPNQFKLSFFISECGRIHHRPSTA